MSSPRTVSAKRQNIFSVTIIQKTCIEWNAAEYDLKHIIYQFLRSHKTDTKIGVINVHIFVVVLCVYVWGGVFGRMVDAETKKSIWSKTLNTSFGPKAQVSHWSVLFEGWFSCQHWISVRFHLDSTLPIAETDWLHYHVREFHAGLWGTHYRFSMTHIHTDHAPFKKKCREKVLGERFHIVWIRLIFPYSTS